MTTETYFQSYAFYFYQWESDDGTDLLSIPKHTTICYRAFLNEVTELLWPQGLPSLGALLLAIAATNPDGMAGCTHACDIIRNVLGADSPHITHLNQASSLLTTLSGMPAEYRTGSLRMQMFQAIFAQFHNRIARKYSRHIHADFPSFTPSEHSGMLVPAQVVIRDIRGLALLNERFPNKERILQAIAQLPQLPDPLLKGITEDSPAEVKISLPEQLMVHKTTFHVGALVPRLWSGLQIPFHTHQPGDQPIGGVSDLSNKGTLDKLLISEYAHDDLTFLSRLANNESLYIKRELPPFKDERQRFLLMDISLRNWGTPKTIAHAIATAIMHHPKGTIRCRSFVIGRGYRETRLSSVDDVINSLQWLDTKGDAGEGLETFLKDHPAAKEQELIYIGAPDALQRPELQRIMQEHAGSIHYWITARADGRIALYKWQHQSRKLLQELQLPLEALWKDPGTSKRPEQGKKKESRTDAFPLMVPQPPVIRARVQTQWDAQIMIDKSKNILMHYKVDADSNKGFRLVYEQMDLPGNNLFTGINLSGDHLLLVFDHQHKHAGIINLQTKRLTKGILPIDDMNPGRQFIFHELQFHWMNSDGSMWCIADEGELRAMPSNYPKEQFIKACGARRESDLSKQTITGAHHSVYKAVQHVTINEPHYLCFSQSVLMLKGINYAFRLNPGSAPKVNTTNDGNRTFTFSDGSQVLCGTAGNVTLKSSDKRIPAIYMTVLTSLQPALATDKHFTGNKHFLPPASTLKEIPATEFNHLYLQPFIDHILKHAAND